MEYAIYNNGTRVSNFYKTFDEAYTELRGMHERASEHNQKISCLGYTSFSVIYDKDINLYEISSR